MSDESSKAARGRAAVLGGCGFIGSHLCRELVARGVPVRIFDKVYAARELIRDVEGDVEIVEGDITRPDDVLAAVEGCDVVVNLVHTTVPGSSMRDPAYDVESNVVASVRWLSRLGETGVRKVVFVSSGGTVYGIPRGDLIDEGHPTEPISSYGITKLAIEKYVAMYATMCGARHVILRPSNVYGEGQRLHIGQGVIGVLADRALRGEPLEVWGEGASLRDYLYVSDLVSALVALLDYGGPQHVFNVASGEGRSVLDILEVLRRQLGRLPGVTHTPARSFDVPANVLDYTRLGAETGWRPRVSLEEGVARVLGWLKGEDAAAGDAPQEPGV
jgi:UDP-glucose 4-epimerase